VSIALLALPLGVAAADFRATADPATVMYDAPSARAKPLYVYGRDIPVETLVAVEGWTKIRDAAGTIGWVQSGMLTDKRMVVVRATAADVRAAADDSAPVVFRADRDVPARNRRAGGVAGDDVDAGMDQVRATVR
jgi:hypothetical protein